MTHERNLDRLYTSTVKQMTTLLPRCPMGIESLTITHDGFSLFDRHGTGEESTDGRRLGLETPGCVGWCGEGTRVATVTTNTNDTGALSDFLNRPRTVFSCLQQTCQCLVGGAWGHRGRARASVDSATAPPPRTARVDTYKTRRHVRHRPCRLPRWRAAACPPRRPAPRGITRAPSAGASTGLPCERTSRS